MARRRLDETEIAEALRNLGEWRRHDDEIQRLFTFADFTEAMKFVNRVGELAEAADHHPDIIICWNKVTLALTTHDLGGLTERDFKLAGEINRIP